MSKPEMKLFIPQVEHNTKTLYTPATKPQEKKPVALFTFNTMLDEIEKELTEEELDKLYDKGNLYFTFDDADKEDLFGNDNSDDILNENEQKNFLSLLKEKLPRIYEVVNKFVENLQAKSDEEKIGNNLSLLQKDEGNLWGNEQVYTSGFQYLSNENFMAIASKYEGLSLLFDAYENAQKRADEEIPDEELTEKDIKECLDNRFDEGEERTEERIKEETEDIINNHKKSRQKYIDTKNGGLKDLEMIKEKSIDYASYVIQLAKKSNIYYEDYAKAIEIAIEKNYIKNLTIYTQRLSDRIFMLKDKEAKTVNASKRAIELQEANGEIDAEFVQGYTGDCWFLSSLKSMCNDKEFLYRINEMITVNKENDVIKSVTVKIQDKEYTIDYKNLKDANEYSTGDLDVRALEMALNQYVHDNNLTRGDITLGWHEKDSYKLLFGEDNVEVAEYMVKDERGYEQFDSESYLKVLKENKDVNIVSGLGIYGYNPWLEKDEELFAEDKDGNQVEIDYAHAYNYTKIDEKYLYFTDPRKPQIELRLPLEKVGETFNTACTVKFKDNKEQASM